MFKMELIYVAKFEKADEGGYSVCFPDIKGAHTCGDTLQEAYYMAEDCLGGLLVGYEEDGITLPKASPLTAFPANTDAVFYNLIKVDLLEYKKKISEKPVRKTVYIPKYLNDTAEAKGINFSRVLREALERLA